MTIREQILQAVVSALAGTTGVGNRIYRSRVEPVSRNESPALIVEPLIDTPKQNTSLPTLDHVMQFRVVVIVRDSVPDQAADPIIESLHSKLLADLTLGGLTMDIQPGPTEFNIESGDVAIGVIFCNFSALYRTRVNDLSLAP